MRLGILETGGPPAELARFGSYADMFREYLGPGAFTYAVYDAQASLLPKDTGECHAYLVTGSSADAYADEPWIVDLKAFLVAARGTSRLLGICFGHQVMAEAFGGRVARSDSGWALGAQTYQVRARVPPFEGVSSITLPLSHRDQVVVAPPDAEIVAGNNFAPVGVLAYTDQSAISLQSHPEFTPEFAAALVERRRGNGLDDIAADAALASLGRPNDRERAAGWLRSFLRGEAPRAG